MATRQAIDRSAEARERLLAGLPVTEERMTIAGVSTAVLEGGDGPPVVLLHGPAGNAAHWMRVIPDLATTRRVIAPDLPGHGASVVEDGELDAERVARLARRADRADLLVAPAAGRLRARRRHRRALRGRPRRPAQRPRARRLARAGAVRARPGVRRRAPAVPRASDRGDARRPVAAVRARPRRPARRMGERWQPFEAYNLDRARTPSAMAALGSLMGELGMPAIPADELARIGVPTTLIWGRHDLATPLRVAEAASAPPRLAAARDRGLRRRSRRSSSRTRSCARCWLGTRSGLRTGRGSSAAPTLATTSCAGCSTGWSTAARR